MNYIYHLKESSIVRLKFEYLLKRPNIITQFLLAHSLDRFTEDHMNKQILKLNVMLKSSVETYVHRL